MGADAEVKVLSVEEMLAADDAEYVNFDGRPYRWPGFIRLGSLTAGELLEFIESNEGPAKKNAGLKLIARSIVDQDNKRIGSDALVEKFKKKNAKIVGDLATAILKLNGMGSQAEQEAAKNASSGAPHADSPTA